MASQSNGIFFNTTTAKKVYGELKFCKNNYPKLESKVSILEFQLLNLNNQNKACSDWLNGCNTDKKDLIKVSGELEKKYIDSNNELAICRESTPSRYLWFSYGVIATSVLGLLGAFLISR